MAYEMGRHQPYPLGEEDRFRPFREGIYRREDLDLQRMENLENWTIAEGEPDIRGWDIITQEGDQVGKVQDLIASPKTQHVYFVLAQIGGVWGMGGKHVLVPLDYIHINREDHQVKVDATRDRLENAIEWRADEEIDYAGAYRYWEEGRAEARPETRELAGVRGGEVPAREVRVPLREEEVVTTREVHAGEVEVEKHVETEERVVDVPVSHTEVEVERRPVTGEARYRTEGEISEGEVRIPVREEEVHVEKRPVVKEEIIVRQHPETEMERHTETVRREVAEVHKEGDVDVETKGDIHVK